MPDLTANEAAFKLLAGQATTTQEKAELATAIGLGTAFKILAGQATTQDKAELATAIGLGTADNVVFGTVNLSGEAQSIRYTTPDGRKYSAAVGADGSLTPQAFDPVVQFDRAKLVRNALFSANADEEISILDGAGATAGIGINVAQMVNQGTGPGAFAQTTAANQPIAFPVGASGGYAYFDGIAGSYASVDEQLNFGNYARVTLEYSHVAFKNWSGLLSNGTSATRSLEISSNATGMITFIYSSNGSTTISMSPTIAFPLAGFFRGTLEINKNAGGYDVATYEKSTDGITWTLHETITSGVATAGPIWDSPAGFKIGRLTSGGHYHKGTIGYVKIESRVGTVFENDFKKQQHLAETHVAKSGQTVTMLGGAKTIARSMISFDGLGDNLVAPSTTYNAGYTVSVKLKHHGTIADSQTAISIWGGVYNFILRKLASSNWSVYQGSATVYTGGAQTTNDLRAVISHDVIGGPKAGRIYGTINGVTFDVAQSTAIEAGIAEAAKIGVYSSNSNPMKADYEVATVVNRAFSLAEQADAYAALIATD